MLHNSWTRGIRHARTAATVLLMTALLAAGAHAGSATRAAERPHVVKLKSVKHAVRKAKRPQRVAPKVLAAAAVAPRMVAYASAVGAPKVMSNAALVLDPATNEVLFSKNEQAVLPIASLTKLMTGLLVVEANLPMDEAITITQADVDTEKGSHSRLTVGASLTRAELMHLALMSSENRAAHALGRTYPGGLDAFVTLMNAKALALGMDDTRYVEPTGLSSRNQSSARDLARLVATAAGVPALREWSTSPSTQVAVGRRVLQFNNTNRLVRSPAWDISLQKTGYISEAGRCLVMQAKVAGRELIMVFLDSAGKFTRLADAERVRRWVEARSAA